MRAKTKLDQFLEDPDPSEAYDVLLKVQELLDQDIKNLHATIGGFMVTARRRVGHNSRTDEVSEAWNNAVERSFAEMMRAVDSAFVDLVNRPDDEVRECCHDENEVCAVCSDEVRAEIDVDKLPPLRVITTDGESTIEVDCCDCGKPLEIEKVRCGDCTKTCYQECSNYVDGGPEHCTSHGCKMDKRIKAPEGMEALTVTMCVTPDVAKAVRSGKFSGLSVSGGVIGKEEAAEPAEDPDLEDVRQELIRDQHKLWKAIRTVERLVHCGCCHGNLETHDGHCPMGAVEALEMRVMNYIASKGENTDGRINRLHSDFHDHQERVNTRLTDHETSIKNQSNKLCELVETLSKLDAGFEHHRHKPASSFLTFGSESAERWHNKQHEAKVDAEGLEAFIPGLGTVRECIDCGCLVPGGPTRCKRCAVDHEGQTALKAIAEADSFEELDQIEESLADRLNKGCAGISPEEQVDHLVENQKGFGRLMACMMNRLGVNEVEFSERQLAFVDPGDVWIENTTREGIKVVKVKLQPKSKAPAIDPRD